MAIIKGAIQMTGSIKGISFYSVRGSDKVIMRTKGGASKNKIATSPKFEGLRKQQKEWSGCAKFGSLTRYAFGGLHRLADYNLTPVLNGFAKNLQKTDTTGEIGKRGIYLSKYRYLMEGFNFNRNYPFNTVLRVGVVGEINRDKLTANVRLPRINTEIDVQNIQKLPYFRLIVALGAVSDMSFNDAANSFEPKVVAMHGISAVFNGEWVPSENVLQEQTMEVQLGEALKPHLTDDVSLILSIAIEFGKVGFTGEPVEVKYAGCGKVLKVG